MILARYPDLRLFLLKATVIIFSCDGIKCRSVLKRPTGHYVSVGLPLNIFYL